MLTGSKHRMEGHGWWKQGRTLGGECGTCRNTQEYSQETCTSAEIEMSQGGEG